MKKNYLNILFIVVILFESIIVYNIVENSYKISELNKNISLKENNIKILEHNLSKSSVKKDTLSSKIKEQELKVKMKDDNLLNGKIAYLTFDDGPSKNTERILKTLKDENIKGTFFVKGSNSEYAKSMYKKIIDSGNVIGNHTYSHKYSYIYSNKENFLKDFNKLQGLLEESIGKAPNILRFPGGSNNTVSYNYGGKNIMRELTDNMDKKGYVYFDWNVDSGDASVELEDRNKIINNVVLGSGNMDKIIVLMHDSPRKTTTADALPYIIKGLKKKGYKFRTLNSNEFKVKFLK